ncbi:hypothetical protein H0G86_013319 [Trichoderma simmonsii]|uniref:Uncharacterized protein n=1 Tax=Trichoderma simmonsii TaxID=1491479 RepID=A0A8G0PDB8_9HYPO|nr:hypothetical protein H0G86_013319 [Trichoderma simmonsii]
MEPTENLAMCYSIGRYSVYRFNQCWTLLWVQLQLSGSFVTRLVLCFWIPMAVKMHLGSIPAAVRQHEKKTLTRKNPGGTNAKMNWRGAACKRLLEARPIRIPRHALGRGRVSCCWIGTRKMADMPCQGSRDGGDAVHLHVLKLEK